MFWITNFPIPPSTNELYETNVTKVWKKSLKTGKPYMGFKTSRRRSAELEKFLLECLSFKNANYQLIQKMRPEILKWISEGSVLRLDSWVAFERSRIWTKDGQPQVIDADNRRKALQDGISKILDLDDKWVYSGIMEKVTCESKDLEQSVIKISPFKCRSLNEIKEMIQK